MKKKEIITGVLIEHLIKAVYNKHSQADFPFNRNLDAIKDLVDIALNINIDKQNKDIVQYFKDKSIDVLSDGREFVIDDGFLFKYLKFKEKTSELNNYDQLHESMMMDRKRRGKPIKACSCVKTQLDEIHEENKRQSELIELIKDKLGL